jgi:hypothetical protein
MGLGKLAVILIAFGLASGGIAAALIDQGGTDNGSVESIELLDEARKDEIAQAVGLDDDDEDDEDDTNDRAVGVKGAAHADGDPSAGNIVSPAVIADDTTDDDYRSIPVKNASAKLADGDDTRGNDGTRGGATTDGDLTTGNDGTGGGDNTGPAFAAGGGTDTGGGGTGTGTGGGGDT